MSSPVQGRERLSRSEVVERLFAVQPLVQRKFNEVLQRELGEELHDVTVHQLAVLHRLRERPLAMRELARSMHVGESTATSAADRLVRMGLVEREADPTDRRVVLLHLTAEGSRLVDRVSSAMASKTGRMLVALSDAQLEQLLEIFEVLGGVDSPGGEGEAESCESTRRGSGEAR